MRTNYLNNTITLVLGLFLCMSVQAQVSVGTYIDAGETNVSKGFYAKTALLGKYQIGKTRIAGGGQFDVKSESSQVFTALNLNAAQEFAIKEFQFEIQGLFIYRPFSNFIHESNCGLLASVELTHFYFKLGTHFRTYRITKKGMEEYDITSNRSLTESWNVMYLAGYNLKPEDHNWNIGLSITNIDYFLINQETNPMFNLRGKYVINTPITLFAEAWYKSAGSLNISANYFGYFFRTGLIWKIN